MQLRIVFYFVILAFPGITAAYGEGYYQSYYQSYYQASYGLDFTDSVIARQNLTVTGTIWKGSGTFAIDHPLDPRNMLLYHSFVESPDVKNLYDGIVTLDENGSATIVLPHYFDALNGNVRYQLSGLSEAMPNLYISQKERDNKFSIAGGIPGGTASWQVTATRRDPYILAYPIIVEVDKGEGQPVEKGQFLHPDVWPEFPSAWLTSLVRTWLE